MPVGSGNQNDSNRISVALDGVVATGALSVTGLTSESEVLNTRTAANIEARPGPGLPTKMMILREWSHDTTFIDWYQTVVRGNVSRKTVAIILHNGTGEAAGRFDLVNCFPSKWEGPAFTTAALPEQALEVICDSETEFQTRIQ